MSSLVQFLQTAIDDSTEDSVQDLAELHRIFDIEHAELFLALLHKCTLTPTEIIDWYDILLRPALRDPSLPTSALDHAKGLILRTVNAVEPADQLVSEFRKRLLTLYLLDAFNDSAREDVIEWASLNQSEQAIRSCYKANLEHILLQFGVQNPEVLISLIHNEFQKPQSRLQLIIFLNLYAFDGNVVSLLASSGFLSSLLTSMLLDHSSTLCTLELSLLSKILPILAVHAPDALKQILPSLLAVLARTLCWRDRPPVDVDETHDPEVELQFSPPPAKLHIRGDLEWQTLDSIFDVATSPSPSPRSFFTILYFLFPCNILRFLRGPVEHLEVNDLQSPYTVGWIDVLDESMIRARSEYLLHTHITHPMIIYRDYKKELLEPGFWSSFDVARIVSEAVMLDVENVSLWMKERAAFTEDTVATPKVRTTRLQEMIATSVRLKTEGAMTRSNSSSSLFTPGTPPSIKSPAIEKNDPFVDEPTHVAAIASLQREVLVLRNDLQFSEWLGRENIGHIGRLYTNRTLVKNAERERQALYNKFRSYRTEVVALKRELKIQKEQANVTKIQLTEWGAELKQNSAKSQRLNKIWTEEQARLRAAEKEVQARFVAQSKLLAEANNELFLLKTKIKENQPKIDRLKDYERQIGQHMGMQKLWDQDIQRFNDRAETMEAMKSEYARMKMSVESMVQAVETLEETARANRRQIKTLQTQLEMAGRDEKMQAAKQAEQTLEFFVKEKSVLNAQGQNLSKQNAELKDELEETRAMVEILRSQVSGRKGLV